MRTISVDRGSGERRVLLMKAGDHVVPVILDPVVPLDEIRVIHEGKVYVWKGLTIASSDR